MTTPEGDSEYQSLWASPGQTLEQAALATEALTNLLEYYQPLVPGADAETIINRSARMYMVVGTYNRFLTQAGADGLPAEEVRQRTLHGMRMLELIDPKDDTKAEEEFERVARGVELNRPYWEQRLGRRRVFFRVLDDPTSFDEPTPPAK